MLKKIRSKKIRKKVLIGVLSLFLTLSIAFYSLSLTAFADNGEILFGEEYVFNPARSYPERNKSTDALDASRFVVVYTDRGNGDRGTAIIGDASGLSITYGNEYVFNPSITRQTSIAALDANRFIVAYKDSSNSAYGIAILGTASGTTISFGDEYVFNPGHTIAIDVAALDANRFVIVYKDIRNNGYGTAVVGTVSGNTLTFSEEYVFNPGAMGFSQVSALDSSHFVVSYQDSNEYGTAIAGRISGDTISFSEKVVYNQAATRSTAIAILDSTRFVLIYRDQGGINYGEARVGTLSDLSISLGEKYVFNAGRTTCVSTGVFDSNQFVINFKDSSNLGQGTAVIGTVSDDSIGFGEEYIFNPAETTLTATAILDANRYVVAYRDNDNSEHGTAVVGEITIGSPPSPGPSSTPSPTPTPSPAPEIVIDNQDSAFSVDGHWGTHVPSGDCYGEDIRFTRKQLSGQPVKSAMWSLDIPTSGDYQVYVMWVQHQDHPTAAQYEIYHNGEVDFTSADQTQNGGIWNPLGIYLFDANRIDQKIMVTNQFSKGVKVCADAVRLVPVF